MNIIKRNINMRTLRLLAAALLAATSAFAGDSGYSKPDYQGNVWSFDYTYAGNVATITGVTYGDEVKESGRLVIPKSVVLQGSSDFFTVKEIRDGAFDGATLIKAITLPSTVEHITGEAFRNMNGNVTVFANMTSALRKELRDGTYGTTRLSVLFHDMIPGLLLPYPDCSKAQTVRGALFNKNTSKITGAVEIKLGKAGKGTDARPVKATVSVTTLDGKKKSLKTSLMLDKDFFAYFPAGAGLSFPLKDLPQDKLRMDISRGEIFLYGDTLDLRDRGLGGAVKPYHNSIGTLWFIANFNGDYPVPEAGWTLLEDALPKFDSITIASDGKKFVIPKATKYKFQKSKNAPPKFVAIDGKMVLDNVKDGANKAGIKLTYNAKTGQSKGSFNIYFLNEAKAKVKSSKVKFSGFLFRYGPFGIGITTDKKFGPWSVEIVEPVG